MRAIAQRVWRARVTIEGVTAGAIDAGLLVYLAAAPADGAAEVAWLARALAGLRVFADAEGRMNRSIEERGGAVLLVSQFTLCADTRRGRRPAFTAAAPPAVAAPLIEAVAAALRARGLHVEQGRFGAHMVVESENGGPVTIILDSADRERAARA